MKNAENLKRQVPRLRDWNEGNIMSAIRISGDTWNDKYLDYEIETRPVH